MNNNDSSPRMDFFFFFFWITCNFPGVISSLVGVREQELWVRLGWVGGRIQGLCQESTKQHWEPSWSSHSQNSNGLELSLLSATELSGTMCKGVCRCCSGWLTEEETWLPCTTVFTPIMYYVGYYTCVTTTTCFGRSISNTERFGWFCSSGVAVIWWITIWFILGGKKYVHIKWLLWKVQRLTSLRLA